MAKFNLKVNGVSRQVDVDPATPVLWVLREHLQLTGTKYGCGWPPVVPVPFISTEHRSDPANCPYLP
jgi:hypothetical protein